MPPEQADNPIDAQLAEVERLMAELGPMLEVEPEPARLERTRQAIRTQRDMEHLRGKLNVELSPAILARTRQAVRRELPHTQVDPQADRRLNPWLAKAGWIAALAAVFALVVSYWPSPVEQTNLPPNDDALVQEDSSDSLSDPDSQDQPDSVDLFVAASEDIFADDAWVSELSDDISTLEQSVTHRQLIGGQEEIPWQQIEMGTPDQEDGANDPTASGPDYDRERMLGTMHADCGYLVDRPVRMMADEERNSRLENV